MVKPMTTFNEFLASGKGNLDRDGADRLLAILTQYGITVRSWTELSNFLEAHPKLFCRVTNEEVKRDGIQTFNVMWHRFEWCDRDPNYVNPHIRPLGGCRRSRRSR